MSAERVPRKRRRIVVAGLAGMLAACGDAEPDKGVVNISVVSSPAPIAAPAPKPSPSPAPTPAVRFTPRADVVAAIERSGRELPPLPPPEALPKPENKMPTIADIERLKAELEQKK